MRVRIFFLFVLLSFDVLSNRARCNSLNEITPGLVCKSEYFKEQYYCIGFGEIEQNLQKIERSVKNNYPATYYSLFVSAYASSILVNKKADLNFGKIKTSIDQDNVNLTFTFDFPW